MTFAFTDIGITVTTWRRDETGAQIWRARTDGAVAEFEADRLTDVAELADKAKQALAMSQDNI